jgi:hypothetical protein
MDQTTKQKSFLKDKHGNYAVFQRPNLPIIVWAVATVLRETLSYGQLNFIAALIAYGAGFTWAWLELFQGDSYIRQILGGIVMVMLIRSQI